ncbi:hypothetical protein HYV10_00940 [Candidatus Dependentiae bacterium]|nr:hypothetical protein [Candidatus Dependentiae bacterium]
MFVLFASIATSVFSVGTMGYLAMTTELGPWIAPIFIVVCTIFMRQFLYKRTTDSKYILAIVASGSIGGMIGMCLGLSFPSFFFMPEKIFKAWLMHPIYLVSIVGAFILVAGLYAFLLGYVLRHYFLIQTDRKFPMSQLVYDVLYSNNPEQIKLLAFIGVILSLIINRIITFSRFLSSTQIVNFNMYPLLASIGFISGQAVAIPVLIGLMTRVITLRLVHIYIPSNITDNSLVITFSMGMIVAWLIFNVSSVFIQRSAKYWQTHSFFLQIIKKRWFQVWFLLAFGSNVLFLYYWNVSVLVAIMIFAVLMLLALYSVDIISTIGILEIQTYVSFVLFGMIYFIPATMITMIATSVLATLCLGIVIDLLFFYKLAKLANVDYGFIIKYQIIAVVAAVICSGIIFWYFCNYFDIQSYAALTKKTYQFEEFFKYVEYNPKIFLLGFVYGILLHYMLGELLAIIGGILMEPVVAGILVSSGAFANLIKKREKVYPVFLGIYAGHILWMLLGMLK